MDELRDRYETFEGRGDPKSLERYDDIFNFSYSENIVVNVLEKRSRNPVRWSTYTDARDIFDLLDQNYRLEEIEVKYESDNHSSTRPDYDRGSFAPDSPHLNFDGAFEAKFFTPLFEVEWRFLSEPFKSIKVRKERGREKPDIYIAGEEFQPLVDLHQLDDKFPEEASEVLMSDIRSFLQER